MNEQEIEGELEEISQIIEGALNFYDRGNFDHAELRLKTAQAKALLSIARSLEYLCRLEDEETVERGG